LLLMEARSRLVMLMVDRVMFTAITGMSAGAIKTAP